MPSANRRNVDLIANLKTAADALETHYSGQTLVFGKRSWTTAELAQAFRAHADALVATNQARQEWYRQARIIGASAKAEITPALVGLRAFLAMQHGSADAMLTTFGFVARHRNAPSAETKRLAVEKRRATRKARGTLGKRQRLAIHGVVEAAPAVVEREPALP
jgi:hypothetical protein